MSLIRRFEQEEGVAILDGNEVLVKAGLENGVAFWTGYPGSPVASIHNTLEQLTRGLFAEKGIVYHRALNEMTAAAELGGSQKAGVNAVATAKNVGFLWMFDQLVYENMLGTGGKSGALVVVGDDIVASSSTVGLDTRLGFELLKMPYLQPSSNQEIKDFFGVGLEISQASGLYVGLRLESEQGDSGSTVRLGPNRYPAINARQPVALNIAPANAGPQVNLQIEQQLPRRFETALQLSAEHGVNRVLNPDAPGGLGLVASGKAFGDLYQTLLDVGLQDSVRILKLGMPYPLDEALVLDFARGVERVVVLESKEPIFEERIQAAIHRHGLSVPVYGKQFPGGAQGFPREGELSPDVITSTLGPLLAEAFPAQAGRVEAELALQAEIAARQYRATPLRLPTFCPGCPHRASVGLAYRMKKGQDGFIPLEQLAAATPSGHAPDVSPEPGLLVHGDIGCYTMALFPPFQMLDTMSSMGQGGAVADGLSAFATNRKVVFVGDGTFIHSGRNSILSSVANKTDVTYIVLDNDTIAMTGGQDSPANSRSESGLDIADMVRGYGVKNVTRIDSDEAYAQRYQTTLEGYLQTPGVNVIIVKKECAITEGRRTRREKAQREAQGDYDAWETHYRIQPDICEMCYDCGKKTGCLGLDVKEVPGTVYGPKMQINKSTCYNDGACTSGHCPSFQTLRIKRADPAHRHQVVVPEGLAEPDVQVEIGDGYGIYMPGVGGMGVLTASALLSYAAMFDGKQVSFTNRIGLSQKNGAVDSHIIIRESADTHATKISRGKTDLYFALDMLEGARPANLDHIAPDRTTSIVNTERTQTVLTIVGADTFPQTDGLLAEIGRYSRHVTDMNAFEVCEKLLGNRQYANIFLLGVAYQMGALPLSAESLEAAIGLNAKAVDHNTAAFRWGRLWVSERARVEAALSGESYASASDLRERNRGYLSQEPNGRRRVAEYDALLADAPDIGEQGNRVLAGWLYTLMQWGNADYAREYLDFVKEVHARDEGDATLTAAVAHNLGRLMAYKDEFEVARLVLSREEQDRLREEYGLREGDRVETTYYLDPPWLRLLGKNGRPSKVKFTPATQPRLLFGALKRLKGLRRVLPPTDEVRRLERQLPGWYHGVVNALLDGVNAANYTQAVEIAEAAGGIVGYDHIKLENWEKVAREVDDKMGTFLSPAEPVTERVAA